MEMECAISIILGLIFAIIIIWFSCFYEPKRQRKKRIETPYDAVVMKLMLYIKNMYDVMGINDANKIIDCWIKHKGLDLNFSANHVKLIIAKISLIYNWRKNSFYIENFEAYKEYNKEFSKFINDEIDYIVFNWDEIKDAIKYELYRLKDKQLKEEIKLNHIYSFLEKNINDL